MHETPTFSEKGRFNMFSIIEKGCHLYLTAGLHSAVGSESDCRSRNYEFESQLGHITFVEIDHEIIFVVILSLPLLQEGQLSVTDVSMCTSTD